jgi:hypothetical protein
MTSFELEKQKFWNFYKKILIKKKNSLSVVSPYLFIFPLKSPSFPFKREKKKNQKKKRKKKDIYIFIYLAHDFLFYR